MIGSEGISVADALALGNGRNGNSDCFGNQGAWWIIIIIILVAAGMWGRNGFGGGNGGSDGTVTGYTACCTPATAQGVSDAFNFNQLDNGIRGVQNGLCDGFYAMAQNLNTLGTTLKDCCCQTEIGMLNGFNGTNQAIANLGYQTSQGFCGVGKDIMQSSFQNQSGFNSIANQLSSCCCDIERGQDAIRCDIAKAANDIVIAGERNTNQILNHLTQTEMDRLRTDLQSAQFQLSQLSQTSNIVNSLMPVAKPAYITCSPYASAFGFGTNGNYYGNGCGCNSCC